MWIVLGVLGWIGVMGAITLTVCKWLSKVGENYPVGLCECGCPAEAHEHYRPGNDCGYCGFDKCERYRPKARTR